MTWGPWDLPTKMFLHFCGAQTSRGMTKGARDDEGVFLLKTTPYFCFLKILLLTFLKTKIPVK